MRAGPMSSAFLYGDVRESFGSLSEPFVRASGGQRARIALLMLPHSEKFAPIYRRAWLKAGAGQVTPIYPPTSLTLTRDQLRTIEQSTGIFMSGGSTATYQRIYGSKVVSRLIRELYIAGAPYGGVSAGAMMACDRCVLGGSSVRTRTNEFQLASDEFVESIVKEHPAEPPGLVIKKGLGLVKDCVLEPHFTEWGMFPLLLEAMRLTRSRVGMGLDGPICLELQGGSKATVRGRGRLYVFTRPTKREEDPVFSIRTYEPGGRFDLREESEGSVAASERSLPGA